MHWENKQFVWLALLRWSGTEPAISPRNACTLLRWLRSWRNILPLGESRGDLSRLTFDLEDGGSKFCRNVELVSTIRRHIPLLFVVTVVRTLNSTAYLAGFSKDLVTGSYSIISDTIDHGFKFRGKTPRNNSTNHVQACLSQKRCRRFSTWNNLVSLSGLFHRVKRLRQQSLFMRLQYNIFVGNP
jgi:hypothetical protein